MNWKRGFCSWGVLGMMAWLTPAFGQDPASQAQNKLLAKRAAEADAYRKLAETIKGVQINSETYVRDFVTESDTIRAGVDAIVKGVRLGQPTYYEDGACEIPAEVTVAQLITELKEIHTREYHGNRIKGTDFENIKQYVQKDIIQVVGMGAPRPELPPDLPEGIEAVLTQVNVPAPKTIAIPEIWKSVTAQQRLMATEAARKDAQRKLLERIKGLRLNSNTLVKDFVTEYDEIRAASEGIVVGAREKGKYLHPDELIVEVTMEVPVESVITQLKELHTRHYKGNTVSGTDIVNLKQSIKSDTFEATGSGVPAPQVVQQAYASISVTLPDWVSTKISATGECTDAQIGTPQGRLKARRCAEMDVTRKLIEQVQGLHINSTTLVRDFVTEHDEINAQLEGILVGAVTDSENYTADTAVITKSLPAMEVWSVIHQQQLIVQRHQ